MAARKLEGPIEERLKKQSSDFEEFKEQQKSCFQEFQVEAVKEVAKLQKDVNQFKEVVAKQSQNFDQQNKIMAHMINSWFMGSDGELIVNQWFMIDIA